MSSEKFSLVKMVIWFQMEVPGRRTRNLLLIPSALNAVFPVCLSLSWVYVMRDFFSRTKFKIQL